MSVRWVGSMLLTLCIGGVIASGVFSWHLQGLTQQVEHLNGLLANNGQVSSESKHANALPLPSRNSGMQILSLQREMAALRQALQDVQFGPGISGLVATSEPEKDAEHLVAQQEKRQYLTELVAVAEARGYWSHEDATIFHNRSIGLSAQAIETIASNIIRAVEEGRMEMPDDLMIPF